MKKSRGRNVKKWAVGIITDPQKKNTLSQTLRSLQLAGWNSPRLFSEIDIEIDREFKQLPITKKIQGWGAYSNWYLALNELVQRNPRAEAYFLCQDNILFTKDLRDYLEQNLWPAAEVGVVSVNCPKQYPGPTKSGFIREVRNWDNQGALTYIFPNPSARSFLSDRMVLKHRDFNPSNGLEHIDSVVGAWCERNQLPYYVHSPGLAQYIGESSTFYPRATASGKRLTKVFEAPRLSGKLDEWRKSDLLISPSGEVHDPEPKTKMAVLVAVFDPTGSSNLFKNYQRFRDELTPDVDVFVAEASYTGRFHIQDATIKINATHRQVLWQKERLFNLLLDQLPPEYECVMWADADIIFENENWLKETAFLLNTHDVVFPYSTVTRLGADGKPERKQRAVPLFDQVGTKPGSPDWHRDRGQGLAWAFRREWLDRHRFDDYCMNGAGDSHDYYAIKGDTKWGKRHCSKGTYPLWLERSKAIYGSKITCASGHVVHLYHGSKNNRQYKPLEDLLKQINFDPQQNIQIAENGLWEWIGKESAYDVIRDSFYIRQAEAGRNKRYSAFLKDGSTKPTWDSPLGEAIMSKHTSKAFAQSLDLPGLRIPETYKLKSNSILKPDRDCGGRRVRVIQKSEDWIYEELIPHDKDYRLYAFGGRVVMLQIDTCKEMPNGMHKTGYIYKRYPDWRTLDIDKGLQKKPSMKIEAEPPVGLPEMVAAAEEISYRFPVPVRVDFFIDNQGRLVYNEMSITPGLVKDGRIRDEGDLWLGSFLNEPLLNLRQAHEPEGGPVSLPEDTGVLTSSDDAFFPAFQLLFVSVMARYRTKFAVVDLGLTARQRAWCEHQPDITLLDLPETLPVSRSAEVWQNWNKPLYFQMSPFKRNLWIDSDCVVMGGLEVMAATLQDRFYTCECVAGFRREDRMTYPHSLFGTKPVNDTLVMAGICGFDRERDAEFIAAWLAKCVELVKAPREKRVMRDQEALQWMVDVSGNHDRIIRGSKWNECNVSYNSIGPREFLNSLPKERANIYHFYGKSKGNPPFWSTWGEVPIW